MKKIEAQDLRKMTNGEGLIVQGCGGDIKEWVDGLNDVFTKCKILLDGTKFKEEDCSQFENDGVTCILFPFNENTSIDVYSMAMWRLQTHSTLGGTWLSDYVNNKLGGFIEVDNIHKTKPDCPLVGEDGNIFNLMGIASRTLKENDMCKEAKEMCERIQNSGSYDSALAIISDYVNSTSVGEEEGMKMNY